MMQNWLNHFLEFCPILVFYFITGFLIGDILLTVKILERLQHRKWIKKFKMHKYPTKVNPKCVEKFLISWSCRAFPWKLIILDAEAILRQALLSGDEIIHAGTAPWPDKCNFRATWRQKHTTDKNWERSSKWLTCVVLFSSAWQSLPRCFSLIGSSRQRTMGHVINSLVTWQFDGGILRGGSYDTWTKLQNTY